jgi:hypothetical protein
MGAAMRALCLVVLLLATNVAANAEAIYVAHEFHVTEGGGFLNKLFKEMSSPEFEAIGTAACAAFGGDCSGISEAAKTGSAIAGRVGSSVYITGVVRKHVGEQWWGEFSTPRGYDICSARLAYGKMSITGGSTFNAVIRRTGNRPRLAFYAVIPKHRSTRQWVNAYLVVKYVQPGTLRENNCAPNESKAWLCSGQRCRPLSRF